MLRPHKPQMSSLLANLTSLFRAEGISINPTSMCAPRGSPFDLFFFLAIDQFFEFWRIFSFFNLGFLKTLLLPQFCSDHYQIFTEGAPNSPPFGLCFFWRLTYFSNFGEFFRLVT